MANQDELRLRIVPELDQNAKKQVEEELDTISGNVPVGGKGGSERAADKQKLADYRAKIDLIDLRARKEGVASIKRVDAIRQEIALGNMALDAGTKAIAEEEQARSQASQSAIKDMNQELALAQQLNLTKSESASIQRKVFFATDRLDNGFTTMSRSMTDVVSNTKSANIAFANFGRIIQDAPFGILGISNNIDPLLVSFRQLKMETGSTTMALRAMLGVMGGPLGLIFLLGSVLPTALVIAERAMNKKKKAVKEAKEEVDEYTQSLLSASRAQLGDIIPSTLSYEQQIKVLESALSSATRSIGVQKLELVSLNGATEDGVFSLQKYMQSQSALDEMSTRTREGLAQASQEIFGATIKEDEAVQKIIQSRLDEARASQVIEDALKRLGIVRQKSIEELREEADALEAVIRYRFLEASAIDNNFTRVLDERRKAGEELRKKREADAQEELRLGTLVGQGGIALTREQLSERAGLYEQNEKVIGSIMSQGARFRAQLMENEKEGMIAIMDLSTSIARGAFGDIKAVAIAEALVNTYVGVTRALARFDFPLSGVIAGLQLANGLAQVDRIRRTTIGGNQGGGGSVSQSISSQSGPKFVTDTANLVAGTITPFGAMPKQSINITANLDRQGLALAVRDGESDIATRQIPFAS